MSWKKDFEKLLKETECNGKTAHASALVLRRAYADKRWLSGECGGKLDKADETLGALSGRFTMGPNDMVMMINYFPDLKDWENGRLDVLRDKAIVQFNRERTLRLKSAANGKDVAKGKRVRQDGAPPVAGNVQDVPPAPAPAVEMQPQTFDAVIDSAAKRIEELETEKATLKAEYETELARLRAENERLKLECAGLRLCMERIRKSG